MLCIPSLLAFTNAHPITTTSIPSVVLQQNHFMQMFEIIGRFYMHFYHICKTKSITFQYFMQHQI